MKIRLPLALRDISVTRLYLTTCKETAEPMINMIRLDTPEEIFNISIMRDIKAAA